MQATQQWPMWAQNFLEGKRNLNLEPLTIRFYKLMLQPIVEYGLDLGTCDREEISKFLSSFRETHKPKPSYYYNVVNVLKMVLKSQKRRDLNEEIQLPKLPHHEDEVKEKLLPAQDVEKLIREAPTPTDRLIIELESELGARAGEIVTLRIKDVQFDKYSAIVSLTGKTGTRSRRVYQAIPDLRSYINNHPHKDDPNAPLLLNSWGKPYGYNGYYERVRELGKRILGRPIYPHMFRHTRATADSSLFTDRELMALNGWRHPGTVTVYSHLSMNAVDEKDLILHGFKSKQEIMRPIVGIRKCDNCHTENAPVALYCINCGKILGSKSTSIDAIREEVRRILKEQGSELLKELAKQTLTSQLT